MNHIKMYTKVYEKQMLVRALKIFSHFCEIVFPALFLFVLYRAYLISLDTAISIGFFSCLFFIVITVARRIIDAPRPKDVFPELRFLKSEGRSPAFPSRHTFSAALISVLAHYFSGPVGCAFLFLSALLAGARFLLGKHFLRDVVCGFLLGAVSGTLVLVFTYAVS